ncbi:MAG TPA: right-handed parallel beta-helix repeat-containing protein [Edaphobacter sp.]|nr:right-handed parallel beta-helix repeat-containing protein [Edaphobacter sp.]
MQKTDLSRRRFLGQTGSLAVALPLASVLPATAESASLGVIPMSSQQQIPNRTLPTRLRGATVIEVSPTATNPRYQLPAPGSGDDCSQAINNAVTDLPSDGGTVWIRYSGFNYSRTVGKNCIYMIDTTANNYTDPGQPTAYYGVKLRSNMLLQLDPGVQLVAMPNGKSSAAVILGKDVSNVEIANGSIIGERFKHSGTAGDIGYGIHLIGVTAATVRAIGISNCQGDGIAISRSLASSPPKSSSDVIVSDVVSTGNGRRNLTIANASSVSVFDSEFTYAQGTDPQAGIGIQPSGTGSATNITIDNCTIIGNEGSGIELYANTGTTISNVNVTNSLMHYNKYSGLYAHGAGVIDTGTIYGNAFFQNRDIGLRLDDNTKQFVVGGASGSDSINSFANNQISWSNQINYPNPTKTPKQGYITGTNMHETTPANNTVNWNNFYSPS